MQINISTEAAKEFEEFFDKQAATMRREQGGLLRKIQDIEKARASAG